jgi:hypothetical protein
MYPICHHSERWCGRGPQPVPGRAPGPAAPPRLVHQAVVRGSGVVLRRAPQGWLTRAVGSEDALGRPLSIQSTARVRAAFCSIADTTCGSGVGPATGFPASICTLASYSDSSGNQPGVSFNDLAYGGNVTDIDQIAMMQNGVQVSRRRTSVRTPSRPASRCPIPATRAATS